MVFQSEQSITITHKNSSCNLSLLLRQISCKAISLCRVHQDKVKNVALCVEVFDKQEWELCIIKQISQHSDVG